MAASNDGKKDKPRGYRKAKAAIQTSKPEPAAAPFENEQNHPLVAAYVAGRLLNEIDWRLQQAWPLPAIGGNEAWIHDRALRRCLTDLPWTLGNALPVGDQEPFTAFCLKRRDEWDALCGSPGHRASVHDSWPSLQDEMRPDSDCSHVLLREDWRRQALRLVEGFAGEVYEEAER